MNIKYGMVIAFVWLAISAPAATAQEVCTGYGPQSPRDIATAAGTNAQVFARAPHATAMNLCNIHSHVNAEHMGPGFSAFAQNDERGGYICNGTAALSPAERADPGKGAFHGVKAGDTLEVHWVYTSCDISPGEGLASCLSDRCANPQLRVETQVFLLVNDRTAANFLDFTYPGQKTNGLHQPKALPGGSGDPVQYPGSTTGPDFTMSTCSPLQVSWSVRPQCRKLDIASMHKWAEAGNVFNEDHAHEARGLVTAPELLAPIR